MTQSQKPQIENLQVELTSSCNERCVHCYLPDEMKNVNESLDCDLVIELLRQFRDMGGKKVVFSGGEILLYKGLFDVLEECHSLNLRILLQSNLLTMTNEMAERFKQLDVFNVQVSLYSTNANIHDSITKRKGSWAKTKRNIELLVKTGVHVLISCPVMKQNLSTVRDLRAYADKLGVDIYFDYVMMAQCDGERSNLDTRLSRDEMKQMIQFMLDSKPEYLEAIATSQSIDELLTKKFARRKIMCNILSSAMCIDTDGSAYPCPGWNGMKLGNIKDTSLSEIWYDNEIAKELRHITPGDFKKCSSCQLHNFCDMCAVYNYNENSDMFRVCKSFCDCAEMMRDCVIANYSRL